MKEYITPNRETINDEIDLVAFFKSIIRQRGLIVGFALAFLMLGLVFQLYNLAFYKAKGLKYPIAVEFISSKSNHYPNGTAFSFKDIIAPDNLKEAIESSNLELATKELSKAISISTGNSLIAAAEKELLGKLSQKKITQEQVTETREMLSNLRLNARTYATLTLDLSKLKISTNDASKLLKQIVSSWADSSLRRGLVVPNISYPKEPFMYDKNAVIIDNYDKLVVYGRYLQSAFSRLGSLSGSDTFSVDGQNLNDLTRKMSNIVDNDINVMRSYAYSISPALIESNPLLEVQIFSQLRVKKLNKEELEKKIKAYDEVLVQLGYAPDRTNFDSQISFKDEASETSLDRSVLSELLNLGSKLSSSELRKEIVNRRITTAEKLFSIEKEIALIEGNANSATSSISQKEIITSMPKIFDKTVVEVNALQETFITLLDDYKSITLNKSSTLYSSLDSPSVTNPLGFPLKRTLIILIAATLMGLFLGIAVALMRSAFRE